MLSLLWRQHKPEEGIHPKREREREREGERERERETKDLWEIQLKRTGCGERILENKGGFQ